MRKPVLAVVAAAMAVTLAPAGASATTPDPVAWGECPKDAAMPGLECATLGVPLDYRHPGGETIEIAISRLRAADPRKRRGVLLTNPGGEGLAFPAVLRDIGLPQSVLDAPGHQDKVKGLVLLDATSPTQVADLNAEVPASATGPAAEVRDQTLAIFQGQNPEQLVVHDGKVESAGDIPVEVIGHRG